MIINNKCSKKRIDQMGCDKREVIKLSSYPNRLLSVFQNEKGLTLVEVLVASVIIVVAALGIYMGILYAESQLNRNYHERVATLLASGECDWQYYCKVYRDEFDDFIGREVIIDHYEESVSSAPLRGMMTMEVEENVDIVFGRTMRYMSLTVYVVWNEPFAGERVIAVREDIFR